MKMWKVFKSNADIFDNYTLAVAQNKYLIDRKLKKLTKVSLKKSILATAFPIILTAKFLLKELQKL